MSDVRWQSEALLDFVPLLGQVHNHECRVHSRGESVPQVLPRVLTYLQWNLVNTTMDNTILGLART